MCFSFVEKSLVVICNINKINDGFRPARARTNRKYNFDDDEDMSDLSHAGSGKRANNSDDSDSFVIDDDDDDWGSPNQKKRRSS